MYGVIMSLLLHAVLAAWPLFEEVFNQGCGRELPAAN
jgi:hypothetical protein